MNIHGIIKKKKNHQPFILELINNLEPRESVNLSFLPEQG